MLNAPKRILGCVFFMQTTKQNRSLTYWITVKTLLRLKNALKPHFLRLKLA